MVILFLMLWYYKSITFHAFSGITHEQGSNSSLKYLITIMKQLPKLSYIYERYKKVTAKRKASVEL
jgi:hypothetical protein